VSGGEAGWGGGDKLPHTYDELRQEAPRATEIAR
jgi:hypothetical protein